jgi:hypothetical protein
MSQTRTTRGKQATKATPYLVAEWRETGEVDCWGEPVQEGLVVGFGWCRWSWRMAALLIDGKWTTRWDHFPKAS